MQKGSPWLKRVLFVVLVVCVLLLIPQVRDAISFAFAFIRDPQRVGSITPSSRFVTQETIKQVNTTAKPIRVLEVGAGTGVFTLPLAQKLRQQDQLDVIELEPEFCALLEEKLVDYPNARVACVSILDWQPGYKYDAIVSSLPFNVFTADMVQAILNRYTTLLKKGGTISYIEYIGGPWVTSFFLNKEEQEQLNKVQEMLRAFRAKHGIETKRVFLNVPPAYVYHLRVEK